MTNRFYWPVSDAQNARINRRVAERLAQRDRDNFERFIDPTGQVPAAPRERLAFYEAQDETYWQDLVASYPQQAVSLVRDFQKLYQRYKGGLPGA